MPYLINIKEELDKQLREQLRKFRRSSHGTDYAGWYRIQNGLAKARDYMIYHLDMEKALLPNDLFVEDGDPINWYYWRDPQESQVNMVKKNLIISLNHKNKRGRCTRKRLELLMRYIVQRRVEEYLNPTNPMEKLKIMCIVGGSGVGKTLASLHLKYHKDANVICSFTTRPPRETEVAGRDHYFIDIVPDKSELIAYTYFGKYYYYAAKWQVFGPCTVYVIDEKGLDNLRRDYGDTYDIHTVYITREPILRRKCGVKEGRIRRDETRNLNPADYDYVVVNNGSKREFFDRIEEIYEEIKNKPICQRKENL